MELKSYLPKSAEDYINCFRSLAALTSAILEYIENKTDWVSNDDRDNTLGRVAESVETISSLRGDNGAYHGSRPDDLIEYQKEMYAIEEQLRTRLVNLGYVYPSR